jgi:hypothetical protein
MIDASMIDASTTIDGPPDAACWTISDGNTAHWSACVALTALAPTIDVTGIVSINTDGDQPSDYACAPLTPGSVNVCALAASTITIEMNAALSAHGTRPLALLGHSIDIQGTIDVASHVHGQRGAGAIDDCNPNMTPAKQGGGGAGGTFADAGGVGGDQGGAPGSGGAAGSSESDMVLRGGCDGRRGGDGTSDGGPNGIGGPGGGAVWIASDAGMLKLGDRSVINASGASGTGATQDGHGGHGGGSGGMIVLQSSTIVSNANAQLFANGGHGGGGAAGGTSGGDGTDPTGPTGPGAGGDGGNGAMNHGNGGAGFPMTMRGANGDGGQQGGGGGGGGGPGVVRITATASIPGSISPAPQLWPP